MSKNIKELPFAVASIVQEIWTDGDKGNKYLIREVLVGNDPCAYSLLGHKKLGSEGYGWARADYSELTLVEHPSLKSWNMLYEAINIEDA